MVYIKVGRLISKNVVTKLLRAVPLGDLEGLKSICVRTVPHKATKKSYRRWGGLHGEHDGHADEGTSRIWIFLWGITTSVLKHFCYGNSNLYDSFIETFALTLYHEIGHHVHSKTEDYKKIHRQLEIYNKKMGRTRKTTIILVSGRSYHVYTDEYMALKRKRSDLKEEIEKVAEEYSKEVLSTAKHMKLLDDPSPTDLRFFNMMRDRMISDRMTRYEEKKREGKLGEIAWGSMLALFDHLRKCKLGNGVKYNLREIFVEIYGCRHPIRNDLRRFKRFALKHVKPFWYVSKRGRKYAYFTEAQMNKLKRRKLGFSPSRTRDHDSEMISCSSLQFEEIMNWFFRAVSLRALTKQEIMAIRVLPKSGLHQFVGEIVGWWLINEIREWTLKNLFPFSSGSWHGPTAACTIVLTAGCLTREKPVLRFTSQNLS